VGANECSVYAGFSGNAVSRVVRSFHRYGLQALYKVDASQVSQIGAGFVRVTDSSIGQPEAVSKGQINDERVNLQLRLDSSSSARAFSNESPAV
jgi:hypothetical protein